jgi:hypothetical protein
MRDLHLGSFSQRVPLKPADVLLHENVPLFPTFGFSPQTNILFFPVHYELDRTYAHADLLPINAVNAAW